MFSIPLICGSGIPDGQKIILTTHLLFSAVSIILFKAAPGVHFIFIGPLFSLFQFVTIELSTTVHSLPYLLYIYMYFETN